MKKIMVALFVAFMVIVGTIGMGSEKALADTQPILKQRVLEVQMDIDEQKFREELARLEEAFNGYADAMGNVDYIVVDHVTYHGMDDVSFTMYAHMDDGTHDTIACNHVTHSELEETIVSANAWTECTVLGDWM